MCIVCSGNSLKRVKRDEVLENFASENAADILSVPLRSAAAAVSRKVFRRIPQGDFMAVTGTDGKRLYMSVKSDSFIKHQVISS